MSEAEIPAPSPPPTVEQAIVKWYSPTKKFGFVLVADKKNNVLTDLFVHASALQGTGIDVLVPQQRIEIQRGETPPAKGRASAPCVGRVTRIVDPGPIIQTL